MPAESLPPLPPLPPLRATPPNQAVDVGVTIAAAQTVAVPLDLEANARVHARLAVLAAGQGVQLLVFPELSLCGYELAGLRACALAPGHPVLASLQRAAAQTGVALAVGAPTLGADGWPRIATWVLMPDGRVEVSGKQHLHPGEEAFARPAEAPAAPLPLGAERVGLAICADTGHASHARAACAAGASVYAASVLVSAGGYAKDAGQLQAYAAELGLAVLMANHAGPSGAFHGAGRSAFWAPGGAALCTATEQGECLVIARRGPQGWAAELLRVPGERLAASRRR